MPLIGEPRRRDYSAEDVAKFAAELTKVAAKVQGVADSLHGFKGKLTVDGGRGAFAAPTKILQWLGDVQRAFDKAELLGDATPEPQEDHAAKNGKKGRGK